VDSPVHQSLSEVKSELERAEITRLIISFSKISHASQAGFKITSPTVFTMLTISTQTTTNSRTEQKTPSDNTLSFHPARASSKSIPQNGFLPSDSTRTSHKLISMICDLESI
jgi:hypothetical protein